MQDPIFSKINDQYPGKNAYNLYGKILKAQHTKKEKFNKEEIDIVEGQIGDETGIIDFRFVGKFAQLVQVDKLIAVRNGRNDVYKEHHRLDIDRWGKLTDETESDIQIKDIKHDNNKSSIAYAIKMVPPKE